MLKSLGHQVSGISLAPESDSIFEMSHLSEIFEQNLYQDIRTLKSRDLPKMNVDVVIHLAAQPLVKASYKSPIDTFQTNVIGTLNVLEASKELAPKAILIITTDKVYKNTDKTAGYVESDPLGGSDPYSASKAAADIATQSWRSSYGVTPISIARAGNVIGGGDFAENRLMPDLVNSFIENKAPIIRYPNAIRPWQHVLDCLNGYLSLVEKQIKEGVNGEWNFSPPANPSHSVADVATEAAKLWGSDKNWQQDAGEHKAETKTLVLDSTKARRELDWSEKLGFQESLAWTVDFYKRVSKGEQQRLVIQDQVNQFLSMN
jgi:CDP-glucose 4,6-dehydratase